MKTVKLFEKKQVFSFEVFPPKRTSPVDTIYSTLDEMKDLHPDYVSVTYGAGGSVNNNKTLEIAANIKNRYEFESVIHLPCINLTKENALYALDYARENGIENILALRGDRNPDIPACDDFSFASDLAEFVKKHGDFNIIGACYPEGHPESENIVSDIRNLKIKVDAGVGQLTSQFFFDNDRFYSFRERAALAGINVPIEAGIMPVANKRQIEKMISLTNVYLPPKFIKMMDRYENDPIATRDAGIAYAVDQIIDLIAQGVDGIHLYTMNNPYIARKIYEAIHRIIGIRETQPQ